LVAYLSSVRVNRMAAKQSWQDIRNRTSVALMLGAGITPGEVRTLEMDNAVIEGGRIAGIPWKLRINGQAGAATREIPIASWAGHLLCYWLAIRADQDIPGQALFPSTKTGKAWGKVSQYNATKEVLLAAGIAHLEGGSFRLRHTFALRQLRRGRATSEVASWLGVTDPAVMTRYRHVLLAHLTAV